MTADDARRPRGQDRHRVSAPPPARHRDRSRAERRLGWLLAGPAFIVMILVTAYPLLYAVVLSLYNYRLTDPADRRSSGCSNYVAVLTDPVWWNDFVTTLIITVVTRGRRTGARVRLRLVMYRILAAARPVRTGDPGALRHHHRGLGLHLALRLPARLRLRQPVVRGSGDFNWFGERWSALFVISLSEIWKTTPFISLLLLAGLVQVPEEMQEAAKVDGATAWQRLWKVTLPNMKAAIMVALLFRTLDAWRIFDNPFVMTDGANNTETLSFLAYRQNVTLVNLGVGLGGLGAAVLHRRAHRLHLHQGLQDRPVAGEG